MKTIIHKLTIGYFICFLIFISGAATASIRTPSLTVGPRIGSIRIDGKLNDDGWGNAACIPLFVDARTGIPADVQTRVFLCWDDQALMVAFECLDPDMANLIAQKQNRDDPLWVEDCVELFIQPPEAGNYYHFIINPLGTLYDAIGRSGSNYNSKAKSAAFRGTTRWTAEIRIPWKDIGGKPLPGLSWRMNFTRSRKLGPKERNGFDLTSWAVTGGSFHEPSRFGHVLFVKTHPSSVRRLELGKRQPGKNKLLIEGRSPVNKDMTINVELRGSEGRFRAGIKSHKGRWRIKSFYKIPDYGDESIYVMLADATHEFYRQAVLIDRKRDPGIVDIEKTLAHLEKEIERSRHPKWLITRYRKMLREGRSLVESTRQQIQKAGSGDSVFTDEQWSKLIKPLKQFRQQLNHPILWTHDPFEEVTPYTFPDKPVKNIPVLKMSAVINEVESSSLLLSNLYSSKPLKLRCSVSALESTEGKKYREGHLELAEAMMIRSRDRGIIADPIVPLDGAGRITLPSGQTRELWLTVKTRGMQPGKYHAKITLLPVDPLDPVVRIEIPVSLRVYQVKLPDNMPMRVYAWDYGRAARSDAYLHDLLEHRVNVFGICLNTPALRPGPDGSADFSTLDPLIDRLKGKGLIFFETWFFASHARNGGKWKPEWNRWIRELVSYMKSKGLDYDDWILHMFDENLSDAFYSFASELKKVDPNVHIFSDKQGSPELIRKFAKVVDYWCPHVGSLTAPGMQAMRASGLPIWTYECGSGKINSPVRNRELPIIAWKYHLDGVGYWCYAEHYGDPWNDLDGERPDWNKVYPGPVGQPISSKRWEAFREGLEFVLMLSMLEDGLKKNGQNAGNNPLITQARQTGIRGKAFDRLRKCIIEKLVKLQRDQTGK